MIRKAEYSAFRAYHRLEDSGQIGADDLFAAMRNEWEWARGGVGRIMGGPGANAAPMLADGRPVPAPDAPSAAPLPDGSGRRRSPAAVRAAGGGIPDRREAADLPAPSGPTSGSTTCSPMWTVTKRGV